MGISKRTVFLHDTARNISAAKVAFNKLTDDAVELSAALTRISSGNTAVISEIQSLGDVETNDVNQKAQLSEYITEFLAARAVIDDAVAYLSSLDIG